MPLFESDNDEVKIRPWKLKQKVLIVKTFCHQNMTRNLTLQNL